MALNKMKHRSSVEYGKKYIRIDLKETSKIMLFGSQQKIKWW